MEFNLDRITKIAEANLEDCDKIMAEFKKFPLLSITKHKKNTRLKLWILATLIVVLITLLLNQLDEQKNEL